MKRAIVTMTFFIFMSLLQGSTLSQETHQEVADEVPDISLFFQVMLANPEEAEVTLEKISENWKNGYASMLIELIFQMNPAGGRMLTPGGNVATTRKASKTWIDSRASATLGANDLVFPNSALSQRRVNSKGFSPQDSLFDENAMVRRRLISFVQEQTGQNFLYDLGRWQQWIWNNPYDPHPDYHTFKGRVLGLTDSRLDAFFLNDAPSQVRLDQIEWAFGGINSIPPLDKPTIVNAKEAKYLKNDNKVFGIVINNEARAYPQRVLAWHEIVHDKIGGVDITMTYCTLTGTPIPYGSEVGGKIRKFGSSGLVYQSNKLMFDLESLTLWTTMDGKPVLGELADSDMALKAYPVVTTTWKEWRELHPNTTVLSQQTGHTRDYSEGAFYRQWASDDRPLFAVTSTDDRLQPTAEILAVHLTPEGPTNTDRLPVAISGAFLEKHRLHQFEVAGHRFVVVTSQKGAHRVYEAGTIQFTRERKGEILEDVTGNRWRITEDALVGTGASKAILLRVPSHRAFWFGWYTRFPDTLLLHGAYQQPY